MAVDLLPKGAVGATSMPDLAFASHISGLILHVGKSAVTTEEPSDEDNPGTAEAPWRTIKHALDSATEGQAILVHEGTYVGTNLECRNSGTRDAPIRVSAAPGESVIVMGQEQDEESFLLRLRDVKYWILEGLEVAAAGQASPAIRLEGAQHVVLRDLKLHGGTSGSGVYMERSENISLLSSEIYNFSQGAEDSHGVAVKSQCKNILIRGVTAYGNSGDGIQLVGEADHTAGPEDVTIEKNHFYSNAENAVDLKSCTRVSVRGNNMHSYQPKATATQADALVVQENASSVLIEHNRIWDCGRGMSLGSFKEDNPQVLGDIVVRRNLLFDVKVIELDDPESEEEADKLKSPGDGIQVSRATRVEIYHNTLYNIAVAAIVLGGENGQLQRCTVVNNIVMDAKPAVRMTTGSLPNGATLDRNLYHNLDERATVFDYDGNEKTFGEWVQIGNDGTSLNENPQFIDNPRQKGFYVMDGSAARNKAIDIGDAFCIEGCDIGALENLT